uniref:Uncharacterized protein n=1 Tax=Setaria italica TaxID=4555 RepID=K3Z1I9_SETIT
MGLMKEVRPATPLMSSSTSSREVKLWGEMAMVGCEGFTSVTNGGGPTTKPKCGVR